jgi:hypothetical protein
MTASAMFGARARSSGSAAPCVSALATDTASAILQHRNIVQHRPVKKRPAKFGIFGEFTMAKMIFGAAALAAAILAGAPAMAQRGPQGPLTRDAYLAMQKERFAAMDANHDGIVTKEELTAQIAARMGNAPPADRIDAMFRILDTDGDGKATTAEADAAEAARFTTLDTDHDGTLTPEERRAGMGGMGRRQ